MDKRRNPTVIFGAATAAPIASDGESRTGADRKARSVPVGRVLEPLRESRAERAGERHGGDELLQPSLQGDSRMENLARLIARLSALPVSVPIVNLFDRVDASALPSLGEQFHIMGVEGWNLAGTETARRALLKRAIELHRHKGTPWAVRTALESALSVLADVEDWFTYGGKPYFFRVILDVTQAGMDEARMADALRIIRTAKNVRSWLDYVRTLSRPSLTLRHAVGVATAGRITIAPWMPGDAPPLSLRTACGAQAVTRITLRPWRPAPPAPRLTTAACPGLTGHTRVRIAPSHHAGVAHV